jgi:hypothetical protein
MLLYYVIEGCKQLSLFAYSWMANWWVCLNRFLGYYYLETMAMEFLQVFKVIHKLQVTKLGKNEELELLVLKFEISVSMILMLYEF